MDEIVWDDDVAWDDDQPDPPAKQETSTAADATIGAGTGLAMGFDDEAAGLGSWLAGLVQSTPKAAGRGVNAPLAQGGSDYAAGKADYQERKDLAEANSPVANSLGQLGGGVVGSLATGGAGAAVKGTGIVANAARTALGAAKGPMAKLAGQAIQGGVEAIGTGDVDDGLKGAAWGAGVGGLAMGATKGAGKLLSRTGKSAESLAKSAQRNRVSAAGINPKQLANKFGPNAIAEQAEAQKRLGIGGGFASRDTIADQAEAATKRLEDERTAIASQLEDVEVPGAQIAEGLESEAAKLSPRADADQIAALKGIAGEYRRGPVPVEGPVAPDGTPPEALPWSFAEADLDRKRWGKAAKFGSPNPRDQVRQEAHTSLNDALEASANAADEGLGTQYRQAGQDMKFAIRARTGAQDKINQEAANRVASPSDYGSALAGAAFGGPLTGMVLGAANRFTRGRERSILASAQEGGSRALSAVQGPATALGRILETSAQPTGNIIGRLAARASASPEGSAGVERVQAAALQGESEAAQAHYLESLTNPDYNAVALAKANQ